MNKVFLIGRLTKDIELKKTQTGTSFARFTLAVNRRIKSSDSNAPTADFISCVVWEKRADTMAQYLNKGSQISIEGRIQTGSYQKEGVTTYTTDIVVENFEFLESRQPSAPSFATTPEPVASYPVYSDNSQNLAYEDNEPILDIASDDLPF